MNLDELEQSVLEQAQQEHALSPASRAAQLSAIESRWGAGDVPSLEGSDALAQGLASGPGSSGGGFWSSVSPLQTLIAGLVVGAAGGFGVASSMGASPPEPVAVAATTPATATHVEAEPAALLAQPLVVEPRTSAGLPEPVEPAKSSQSATRAKPPAEQQERKLSFHEELSHLKRAQKALRSGNAAMAYGLMSTLDETFPSQGALLIERRVTQVLALCRMERAEDARVIATQLSRASGSDVYRERLRGSCVAEQVDSPKIDSTEMDPKQAQH